jgi:para-nitrobenzyl esterase
VTTEAAYGARTYSLASRKAALGDAPVWVYRLEWETPVEGGRLKTPHALDLPLVFDTVASSPSIIGDGATEAQRVADMMSAYWISFARDGDPNAPDLPQWPAYDDKRKATMVFNVESAAKDDPVGDVRAIVLPD